MCIPLSGIMRTYDVESEDLKRVCFKDIFYKQLFMKGIEQHAVPIQTQSRVFKIKILTPDSNMTFVCRCLCMLGC